MISRTQQLNCNSGPRWKVPGERHPEHVSNHVSAKAYGFGVGGGRLLTIITPSMIRSASEGPSTVGTGGVVRVNTALLSEWHRGYFKH